MNPSGEFRNREYLVSDPLLYPAVWVYLSFAKFIQSPSSISTSYAVCLSCLAINNSHPFMRTSFSATTNRSASASQQPSKHILIFLLRMDPRAPVIPKSLIKAVLLGRIFHPQWVYGYAYQRRHLSCHPNTNPIAIFSEVASTCISTKIMFVSLRYSFSAPHRPPGKGNLWVS